jgi:hypothetical protein
LICLTLGVAEAREQTRVGGRQQVPMHVSKKIGKYRDAALLKRRIAGHHYTKGTKKKEEYLTLLNCAVDVVSISLCVICIKSLTFHIF